MHCCEGQDLDRLIDTCVDKLPDVAINFKIVLSIFLGQWPWGNSPQQLHIEIIAVMLSHLLIRVHLDKGARWETCQQEDVEEDGQRGHSYNFDIKYLAYSQTSSITKLSQWGKSFRDEDATHTKFMKFERKNMNVLETTWLFLI